MSPQDPLTPAAESILEAPSTNRLFPIEGVGPDFAVVGASMRG